MLTTSHMLIGAAATTGLTRNKWQIAAGWAGGFAPDASVFVLAGIAMVQGKRGAGTWGHPDGIYWQEPWQTLSAISNSIPLWFGLSLIALFIMRGTSRLVGFARCALIFSVACLLHVVADLLTHAEDAHVHFWPLTDWRFQSPVSYYQRAYHGELFSLFELGVCVVLAGFLFVTFKQWQIRVAAVLMAGLPLMMRTIAGFMF